MLEKVSQMAQDAATNVSRRQFLGRFGRGAMAIAAATGGLLALPTVVKAARRGQICGTNSSLFCLSHSVGGACGSGGKCTVIKGTVNDCYCRDPGNPGRGG